MTTQTIKLDGRDVCVATTPGQPGRIPLLLFNGIGANLRLARPFANALAEHGIGIVIFDVPGIGGSDPVPFPYRLPWLARLAARVLSSIGHDGPIDVAGVSWGGVAAQEFAHRFPSRVRHLILCATSTGHLMVPANPFVVVKLANPRRYTAPDYMLKIGAEIYGGMVRRNPAILREYIKDLTPPRGTGYFYQLLAGAGWTSVCWLRTLRMPALVMYGTDDPIMPVINGRILAALLPNSQTYTMDDGHLFLVTRPKECASVVAEFVARG